VGLSVGESVLLYAAPADSRGRTFTGLQTITWSSSNPAVVSVQQTGEVTGVAAGSATVTAKAVRLDTGASASASVMVNVTGGAPRDMAVPSSGPPDMAASPSGPPDMAAPPSGPVDLATPPPLPVTGALAESAMPSWRQGQAVGEWREIAGSPMSAAPIAQLVYGNTGPQSKVVAWTGFAIDTRDSSIYSVANGGHGDYGGNEVDRIQLLDAAPSWTEQRSATPAAQATQSVSYYADGRPTSRHTYYGATFDEARGRAVILGGARWGNGWALPTVDGFDIAANDWDGAGAYPDAPTDFVTVPASAVVEDKRTSDIYVVANYALWRFTGESKTWSKLSDQGVYGQYAASALDTKRNRFLLQGGLINEHSVYDLTSDSWQTIDFTGANASAMTGDTGNGLLYDPAIDAYLLRKQDAGGTVYRINAQTFAVDTLPTSNGTAVPNAINGVWKRFLYVPQLKGVIYFPSYDGNAWFLRTS
jgi:hypothetical protein